MSVVLNGNTYDISDFTGTNGRGYTDIFAATGLQVFPESIFTDMLAELAAVPDFDGLSFGAAGGIMVSSGSAWVRATGATITSAGAASFAVSVNISNSGVQVYEFDISTGDSGGRNWHIAANRVAFGDLEFMVGASNGGAPTSGTQALLFDRNANATFGATLTVTGVTTILGTAIISHTISNPLVVRATSSAGSAMAFQNSTTGSTGGDGFQLGIDADEGAFIWNYEATELYFATSNVRRFTIGASGLISINETSNVNMTIGLTINQASFDNQILCFKSFGDIGTGLTSGTISTNVETDDFYTLTKNSGTTGGVSIQVLMETAGASPYTMDTYSGGPAITDTTASLAAMNFFVAEHDGSNGLNDMAANSNAIAWGEITSGGGRLTRMLLKADDGELHLGNTTLVALDEEDDISLVRAMQWETSKGQGMRRLPWNTEDYGVPAFSHEKLMAVGVLGEKDGNGFCLMRVQPRFAMNEGAIWQNYVAIHELADITKQGLEDINSRENRLEACIKFLVEQNPSLTGREGALALLEAA